MPLSKIDSDSLNSGAVTSTALAAGSVASTALASGVPTRAQMPSGSVLQVASVQSTTQVVVNTGGPQSIGLSTSMTVLANSKVCMMSVVPWYDGGGSAWTNAGTSSLWVDGVQVAYNEHNGTITNEAASWNNTLNFVTAALTAGSHTFEVKHAIVIAATHYCMRDGRLGSLILMEIAA